MRIAVSYIAITEIPWQSNKPYRKLLLVIITFTLFRVHGSLEE